MYEITVYLVGKEASVTLKTENRKLARALVELSVENDKAIKVEVAKEVESKPVKFSGID